MVLSRQLVALLYEELAIQTEQDSQITPYLIKKNALVLALPFDSFSLKLKIKGLVPPGVKFVPACASTYDRWETVGKMDAPKHHRFSPSPVS